ncbi:MAG TPA: M23 family metallopeptidase [Candidatus Limnocylindrales bacterium]
MRGGTGAGRGAAALVGAILVFVAVLAMGSGGPASPAVPVSVAGGASAPAAASPPAAAPDGSPAGSTPTVPALAPDPRTLTGYRWPLTKGRLTTDYGPTDGGTWVVDGARFHDGIDLASFCGDRVGAAHDGVVLAAGRVFDAYLGWIGDLGPYEARLDAKHLWLDLPITVVIDDGDGYRTIYAHLSEATVKPGEAVHAGQLVGREGRTGHATGCHLHFGLFSPLETATFELRRDVARRWLLPDREIARIDPTLVLPPRPKAITLGWGVTPRVAGQLPPRPGRGGTE